jgi:hypothetical protein
MNYAALVFWALIAWSATARPGTLLILLIASIPFASLALLPPEIAAGMSILPQTMFAVLLILKVLAPEVITLSPKLVSALRFKRLGYLALFLLVGIVATVIMPKLFVGEVIVVPMKAGGKMDLLSPIQANFTQSGYVALSVLTAFAVTLMSDEPGFAATLLMSVLAGGMVCIATGLIDFAAAFSGTESLLEPFRNAGYAYLTDVQLGGVRRIVGFTPEASEYGAICVQFSAALALLRHLYAQGSRRMLATIVACGLAVMGLLSTSSTAYGGLAVLGLAYAANWLARVVTSEPASRGALLSEMLVGLGLVIALLIVLISHAGLFDPLLDLVGEVIFNKPQTSSFYERSEWNSVAWDAFTSTRGLGIGFGSTRASNWFAAVVSSSGLIGAALMGVFLIQIFSKRPTWRTPFFMELLRGLKLTLLPALAMEGVAAPGPDFGLWIAVVFGAITGLAAVNPTRSPIAHLPTDGRTLAHDGRTLSPTTRRTSRNWRRIVKPAPRTSF